MIKGKAASLLAASIGGLLLTGCVMTEKYEAEKARSLNFQRLLAQEEKRTGELDAELKRVKRDSVEMDARNRELKAQVEALREQMARIQEEAMAASKQKEQERDQEKELGSISDMGRDLEASMKPKRGENIAKGKGKGRKSAALAMEKEPELEPLPEPSQELDMDRELAKAPFGLGKSSEPPADIGEEGTPRYHVVQRGENLYRIGLKYRVSVDKLKEWNSLRNNEIAVGQKLVVGHE
jgi:LysM repeat protein/outer membrane murein-binding lipoprotein Lpp